MTDKATELIVEARTLKGSGIGIIDRLANALEASEKERELAAWSTDQAWRAAAVANECEDAIADERDALLDVIQEVLASRDMEWDLPHAARERLSRAVATKEENTAEDYGHDGWCGCEKCAPTDDEREALARILIRQVREWPGNLDRTVREILAAGFHRTVQGERHDEDTLRKVYEVLDAATSSREESTDIVNALQNAGILFRERTLQGVTEAPNSGSFGSVQGEPSDVAVQAAAEAFESTWNAGVEAYAGNRAADETMFVQSAMRAALRAAAATEGGVS